jgi:sigma-B regulation protein RsbU (phosphoserine phosphatase)
LGVGGDYYDFIHQSTAGQKTAGPGGGTTELGVAIGDVSGKGIPAALLMATLRAFVRAQTIRDHTTREGADHPRADLASMMANLNTLVFESSTPNKYATFFYGHYDAARRALWYVNAGHNPPALIKTHASEVVRLDAGGPVIGLFEDCAYTQACVTVEPGDVLVAFTDGISEAMNIADEEWGEDQVFEIVRANRTHSAQEIIGMIMREADRFTAGAPQHDDMTLIVIRVET